jgi:hypothetical protein
MQLGAIVHDAVDALYDLSGEHGVGLRREIAAWHLRELGHQQATDAEVYLFDRALKLHLEHLVRRLDRTGSALDDVEDGMHRLDALAARYLEELGAVELAEDWRDFARSQWATYLADRNVDNLLARWLVHDGLAPDFIGWFGPALWQEVVKAELAALRSHGTPCLARGVLEHVRRAFWAKRRIAEGQDLTDARGNVLATLRPTETAPTIPIDLARWLTSTENVAGQLLFRFLVRVGHTQAVSRTPLDFRCIRISGGFRGLAAQLGRPNAADEVYRALQWYQHAHLHLADHEHNGLLTFSVHPEAPGRPAELRIVLGDALLPFYVIDLPRGGRAQREARQLIPVPSRVPPLFGHPRHHAGLLVLQVLVMRELRLGATELVRTGTVPIPVWRFSELAEEAGVPDSTVREVVLRWSSPRERERFLRRHDSEPDRFTLAAPYASELLALEQAGRDEERGRRMRSRTRRARERTRHRGGTA